MTVLSASEIYRVVRQAGFSPDQAVTMTAIALAESGGNSRALNPNGEHSVGLFQINMRAHGDRYGGEEALYDPLTNARAAWEVSGQGASISPWTVTHQSRGAPYTRHIEAARAASSNAGENGVGNFNGSPGYGSSVSAGSTDGAGTGVAGGGGEGGEVSGPVELPPDAQVYTVDGTQYATFRFRGQVIAWEIDGPVAGNPEGAPMSPEEFAALGAVEAGSISELGTVDLRSGETFEAYLGRTLDLIFPDPDAWSDPSVVRAGLEFVARPDMGEAELQRMIENTAWYQSRTDRQRQWDDLAPAEQQQQVDSSRLSVVDTWFRETGQAISQNDPRVQEWATQIASGRLTLGQLTLQARREAESNPESPWSRRLREEAEQSRQRGIDIEDQQGFVRRLSQQWGVQLSDESISGWASGMVENRQSEDDLLEYLKGQAEILYPWKDRELATMDAAEPWLQTYRRVMEGEADIYNGHVQRALQSGTPVFDFERELKATDDWMVTKNAQDEVSTMLGQASQIMGFS